MSSGASSRQGTHHDAHTLSSVTSPLKAAPSRPGHRLAVALEAGKRRQAGRRRRLSDQGGRNARGIAGAEAVHEQRGEREKGHQRDEHDQSAPPDALPCSRSAHARRLLLARALRAPRDPPRFEFAERAGQMPAVEHDPHDQPGDDPDRGGIGGHDECGMRTEVHRHARRIRLHQQHGAQPPPHDLVAHGGQMQRQEQQRERDRA